MGETLKTIIRYSSWFFNLPSAVKTDKSFNPQKAQHGFIKGNSSGVLERQAFIKECVYIHRQNIKAYNHKYIHIFLLHYVVYPNIITQKAIILQTSKNVPCMIKAKLLKVFQPQLWQLKCHNLKKILSTCSRNQYEPLALSRWQAVVVMTSLIPHASGTHSWCKQKYIWYVQTENLKYVLSSFLKVKAAYS